MVPVARKMTILFILAGLLVGHVATLAQDCRKPAVAGQFYPASKQDLQEMITGFMEQARPIELAGRPVGLVVPHAGYPYCARIMASGYRQVMDETVDVVVVIAPSHRDRFRGATIFPGDSYETPLGSLDIDRVTAKRLVESCEHVRFSSMGHRSEHALEVQLPFIQHLFGSPKLIPVVVGGYDWDVCQRLGTALARALGESNVLIVASTDLYHGYSYSDCHRRDRKTLNAMETMDPKALCQGLKNNTVSACGGAPVVILQVAARQLGADRTHLIDHTTSADVTGDSSGYVVGYGSAVLYKAEKQSDHKIYPPLDEQEQRLLLKWARESIRHYIKTGEPLAGDPVTETLKQTRGVFVTLTQNGRLRGCIGSHQSDRPLYELVPNRACAAAFQDPRFPPLSEDELDEIDIKVSVYLTDVYPIDDLREFKLGTHGIIMMKDGRGATYLPEVPLQAGWASKEEELSHLCRKAGLAPDAWKQDARFWLYRTQVFEE
jgi:hypothetical protein